MGSIGLAIIYGFKVNVSVAIVAMVNHTAVKLSSTLHQFESSENATNVITDGADECRHDDISSNATKIITEVRNVRNFINNFINNAVYELVSND